MRSKILLCTDGTPPSSDAADYALQMAKKCGALVVALRVIDNEAYANHTGDLHEAIKSELENHAGRVLDGVKAKADKEGVEVVPEIRHGEASEEIIGMAAEDEAVMLVVMGATGRRAGSVDFFGSVVERVTRQVGNALPCAVAVIPSKVQRGDARLNV